MLLPLFQHQYRSVTIAFSNVKSNFSLKTKQGCCCCRFYVAGGDDWKLVAEELGLNPAEIRFLDNRTRNPADVTLSYVANQRVLTVGHLYDVLAACGLPLIADDL